MSKCRYCNGKGTYVVKETYGDGDEALIAYECNHCNGTGVDQDPEQGEDFDVPGGDDD